MAYYLQSLSIGGPSEVHFEYNLDYLLDDVVRGGQFPHPRFPDPSKSNLATRSFPTFFFMQVQDFCISERMLTLLNELAPNSIEALPLQFVRFDGESLEEQFYLVNVLEFRDSLILDDTNYRTQRLGTQGCTRMVIDYRRLKMRISDIVGAHIWHEMLPQEKARHEVFISDELFDKAKRLRLSGLSRAIKITEI